jgi:hypothetical protein
VLIAESTRDQTKVDRRYAEPPEGLRGDNRPETRLE